MKKIFFFLSLITIASVNAMECTDDSYRMSAANHCQDLTRDADYARMQALQAINEDNLLAASTALETAYPLYYTAIELCKLANNPIYQRVSQTAENRWMEISSKMNTVHRGIGYSWSELSEIKKRLTEDSRNDTYNRRACITE